MTHFGIGVGSGMPEIPILDLKKPLTTEAISSGSVVNESAPLRMELISLSSEPRRMELTAAWGLLVNLVVRGVKLRIRSIQRTVYRFFSLTICCFHAVHLGDSTGRREGWNRAHSGKFSLRRSQAFRSMKKFFSHSSIRWSARLSCLHVRRSFHSWFDMICLLPRLVAWYAVWMRIVVNSEMTWFAACRCSSEW